MPIGEAWHRFWAGRSARWSCHRWLGGSQRWQNLRGLLIVITRHPKPGESTTHSHLSFDFATHRNPYASSAAHNALAVATPRRLPMHGEMRLGCPQAPLHTCPARIGRREPQLQSRTALPIFTAPLQMGCLHIGKNNARALAPKPPDLGAFALVEASRHDRWKTATGGNEVGACDESTTRRPRGIPTGA